MTNYEKEAEEIYPDIPAYNKAFTLTERAAHIKARQMSEQEIRELQDQARKLREVFEELISTIERNAVDNKEEIHNVKLWAKQWREELLDESGRQ